MRESKVKGPMSKVGAPCGRLQTITFFIMPEALRMVRLTWSRRATSRIFSMTSLPKTMLIVTSFTDSSMGWPTEREVGLGLFLEPFGLLTILKLGP